MQENFDYVNYYPDTDTSLIFCLNGNAKKAFDEFEEILTITRELYDILHGFYKPIQIGYGIYIYSENVPVNRILELDSNFELKIKPLEKVEKTICSEEGVTYEDLNRCIRSIGDAGRIPAIRGIGFLNGKTNFALRSGNEYVSRYSKNYFASPEGGAEAEVPRWDPLSIGISLWPYTDSAIRNSNLASYELVFKTYTDMWFAENELGIENQRRLKSVLKKVYDRFDINEVFYYSDHFDEDWLKDVIPKVSL